MHVTGGWALAGAVVTALILADVLAHWKGANALFGTGSRFTQGESKILAGGK